MTKREEKKVKIIKAAEVIFGKHGFDNANMNDIAKQASVSKGTVYFYFKSKENLYMAVAHRALSTLNNMLHEAVHKHKTKSGLEGVLAIVERYMEFSEHHPLYSEAMLEYMTIVRSNSNGLDRARTSKAIQESIYFSMMNDIHNVPLHLTMKEIARGRKDDSIQNQQPSEMLYMTAWALVLGYMKISKTSPSNRDTLFTIPIAEWRKSILESVERILVEK